ncbi:Bicoid-interacting protein 3-domain-containing protein [Gamsiella multidivaricata]|uniref:Bicoid-interacting protein 3-domain-containing protein n=1 Tax=Gamsiella multidivaricata TaxID=101098 RepID=UPI00221E4483|nr:Bicoid-interacting protein 3-domain-containing protein [Gamsiella multidivaricata]KAI7824145.1 Bicoid-interacting protein 3-domain-containing protein [Gamsiella multidivaricata]
MSLADLAKRVDLRLEFLDPTWFRGKRVLDIGCNSALLTVFIALHYKPKKIQGVDIDPSLIGKAQNFVTNIDDDNDNEEGEGANQEDLPYEEYFPRAMYRIHGLLPVPERTSRTEVLFPHNIELRVADWVTETDNHQDAEAEQWDIIFAFSLTKWVHLHHGDAGLKRFFQKIYRSLAKGGILLLEPQAYETYNRRSKILPEMQTTYKEIAFRPEMFQEYLLGPEVGFREGRLLGHSEGRARNFNRDIYMYRK